MGSFDIAYITLMDFEGGLTSDHAGLTNAGITMPALREVGLDADGDGDIDENDLRGLNENQKRFIYRKRYWDRFRCGEFGCQEVCTKHFLNVVNMGEKPAVRIVQRALRACGYDLPDDGVAGSRTMGAIGLCDYSNLAVAMRSETAGFYRLVLKAHPEWEEFREGWMRRAYF